MMNRKDRPAQTRSRRSVAFETSLGSWTARLRPVKREYRAATEPGVLVLEGDETAAAITILSASHLGLPVSTTHVISGAIMGVGSSQRISAVRWGVTRRIAWAWVLTIPISAVAAFACYLVLRIVISA
jgi:PiT family inorganic phosphate transporter